MSIMSDFTIHELAKAYAHLDDMSLCAEEAGEYDLAEDCGELCWRIQKHCANWYEHDALFKASCNLHRL